jgi:hypothetical protein
MKESARYAKIVEWSEEDRCYEQKVFEELCDIHRNR